MSYEMFVIKFKIKIEGVVTAMISEYPFNDVNVP